MDAWSVGARAVLVRPLGKGASDCGGEGRRYSFFMQRPHPSGLPELFYMDPPRSRRLALLVRGRRTER